jgi:uncharacterized protein with PIN domain
MHSRQRSLSRLGKVVRLPVICLNSSKYRASRSNRSRLTTFCSQLRHWRRFGKGRHPAQLNLGDCFAYALAPRSRGMPLLFKGDDFNQTDIPAVI